MTTGRKLGWLAALISGLIGVGFLAVAEAQTPAQTPGITVAKTEISTRAKIVTDIPLNTPRPVDLGGLVVPGASADLTDGVTVKAFTRYVEFEGRKIGQVVLSGVEKNGKVEALPAESFAAQFDLPKAAQLDPAAPVVVKGDAAALLAALNRLKTPVTPAAVAPVESTQAKETPRNAQQSGGGVKENSQAAAYRPPEPLAVAQSLPEGVRVTEAGCTVRIDVAQLKAVQQSRTETTKGGAVVSESECTDSGTSFPLQKSYSGCSDAVDLAARTATAQYVLFYIDGGGARKEISECAPDAERVFPIAENFTACTVSIDYQNGKAVPQSSLVYHNVNNVEVQVRGCQPSDTKPAVTLATTTSGCSIRHDYALGKSYQQETKSYVLDGILYQAGGCTDNGTEYPHSKIVKDSAGAFVCSPVVDMTGKTVTLQSRVSISVGGVGQYISECAPEPGGPVALTATTEGCDLPASWDHDLSAARSYAKERFYYMYSGIKEYATQCIRSAVSYVHQLENAGWSNFDGQLYALEKSTVYITPASGRYNIVSGEVQPGAVQMPYQLTGTTTRQTANVTYEGCSKYVATELVDNWKRPDTTIYEKVTGPGAAVGPTNACTAVVTWANNRASSGVREVPGGACPWYSSGEYQIDWDCAIDGTNKKTREDGVVVSSQSATCGWASGGACGPLNGSCEGGNCPYLNCPAAAAPTSACRSNWGWY